MSSITSASFSEDSSPSNIKVSICNIFITSAVINNSTSPLPLGRFLDNLNNKDIKIFILALIIIEKKCINNTCGNSTMIRKVILIDASACEAQKKVYSLSTFSIAVTYLYTFIIHFNWVLKTFYVTRIKLHYLFQRSAFNYFLVSYS